MMTRYRQFYRLDTMGPNHEYRAVGITSSQHECVTIVVLGRKASERRYKMMGKISVEIEVAK